MSSVIKYLLIFCVVLTTVCSNAQIKLSEKSGVSLLTMGPGITLNDSFGHSAFRIYDVEQNIDIIFDYGRYNFNKDGFYLNFVKGKLEYEIDWSYYKSYIEYYKNQGRSIHEQTLNLSLIEKQDLLNKLQENIKPANKNYLYDFFYNNCSTKIKDDLFYITKNNISFPEDDNINLLTFRELIRSHVPENSWGGFGIDLALGSVIDVKATIEEHTFLPIYLQKILDGSKLKLSSKKLVKKSITLSTNQKKQKSIFLITPLFILGLFSILIIITTYNDWKLNKRKLYIDCLIFFSTGTIGILILFLWFLTDHKATAFNYNFLWAFAFNILFIPTVLKPKLKKKFISYLKFLMILIFLAILHWTTGVQSFNYCLIPIFIALGIRYSFLIYFSKKNNF